MILEEDDLFVVVMTILQATILNEYRHDKTCIDGSHVEKKEKKQKKPFSQTLKDVIYRRVHILSWLPSYDREAAVSDMIAGITIGLTLIPQSIAYAALAGLTAQYGLYSAFMGAFLYVIFGTIKEVSLGPTSLVALMVLEYCHEKPVEYVVLLGFLAGCIELMMGLLKLGFLVDFISAPIVSGFTSAMSLIIICAQAKGLLGLHYTGHGFVDTLMQLIQRISNARLADSILALCCIVFLLTLRQIKDLKVSSPVLKRTLWFISTGRNALIVLITALTAYFWERNSGKAPFILSGKVQAGLPPFGPPPFEANVGNRTVTFVEMCSDLGSAIIVVPLVCVLANVAIAKAFSVGCSVDASQEMFTLGICNIFGSFVKSIPTCGAFTRSAVSNASGVRSPMAGLYSGTMTLLALSFLTPYFYYIPRATLSSVLICAVMFMFDWQIVMPMWRTNKLDVLFMGCTFAASLYKGVEFGLSVGVILTLCPLLYLWARPEINHISKWTPEGLEYRVLCPDTGLYFPSVDFLKGELTKVSLNFSGPLILDCSKMHGMDYSAAKGIESLKDLYARKDQILVFLHLNERALKTLKTIRGTLQYCSSEEELLEKLTLLSNSKDKSDKKYFGDTKYTTNNEKCVKQDEISEEDKLF
ncbi:sodium-independent sulfate anion transporter-like [Ctenocephalides felis]|uniref:sodium-independent sulfate anion transporter-like n=1 Tax=Ctenocephalides felis TaxID=7515 RepID=UPI000E6E368C|nr:sodium-independent sulfate anion transporter-like [Ctenocephalides felis]